MIVPTRFVAIFKDIVKIHICEMRCIPQKTTKLLAFINSQFAKRFIAFSTQRIIRIALCERAAFCVMPITRHNLRALLYSNRI